MPIKLTENQRALIEAAAGREDRCFVLPSNLKGGTTQKVAAKLIAQGLAKEIKAKAGAPIWRRDGDSDQAYCLKLSAAGARAMAPSQGESGKPEREAWAQGSPPASMDSSEVGHGVAEPGMAAPRKGSKLASLIALLRRSEGATITALTQATGWLPHTTRAAIAGVRKRGYSVILDRDLDGASVYRLSDPKESEAATCLPQAGEAHKASRRRRKAKAKAAA